MNSQEPEESHNDESAIVASGIDTMLKQKTQVVLWLLCCVVMLALAPVTVLAQADVEPTVVILGMAESPPGVRATVYINHGKTPEAVIAVNSATVTEEDLAEAFKVLRRMRKMFVDKGIASTPTTDAITSTELRGEASKRELTPDERKAYRNYIKSFKDAPDVKVPHVGKGKAVEVKIGS